MLDIHSLIVGVEMPEVHPWNVANINAPNRLAVRQAFDIAASMKRPVHLVAVLPEVVGGYFGSQVDHDFAVDGDRDEAAIVLKQLVEEETQRVGGCTSTFSVMFGRPWYELLRVASKHRDNLLICGTRKQGSISRFLFGSTGLKLLRHAECPVWLVKPRTDDDAILDILCTSDLTEVGEDVVSAGVLLSQHIACRLNVVHVVDHDLHHLARTRLTEQQLADQTTEATDQAEAKLHSQISLTDYRTLENGLQAHVKTGSVSQTLLEAIEELQIDVLVLATRARDGLAGMVFGNTAEQLLWDVPCSVLAVKPDTFQSPISFDDN
ncbi:MAG: universal stress protein [Fuerstiella sp.]